MQSIKNYVNGELNGELNNNEFMTTRMNIINAVNKMNIKSEEFKDGFENNPVRIKISEYLKLLFKDNYETIWRFKSKQFQRNNLHNYIKYQKLKMNQNEVQVFVKTCEWFLFRMAYIIQNWCCL
ncbi:unnamed protein product [Paramecium sonneborni]|uniref:Uncharacterized protein n=1 Tax=Paramecium sonneborni TaxID=65129 RepID=A0A8S1M623_9CILI|nr:unnamed protein product [Paramecium sonneborni]